MATGGAAWIGLVADAAAPDAPSVYLSTPTAQWPQHWDAAAAAAAKLSAAAPVGFLPAAGVSGRVVYTMAVNSSTPGPAPTTVLVAADCPGQAWAALPGVCRVAGCTVLGPDGSWRGAACDGSLLAGAPLPALCWRAAPLVDECAAGLDNCDAAAACVDTPGSFYCNCSCVSKTTKRAIF